MFDVNFTSVEEKEAFMARLKRVRQRLTPRGRPLVDNRELMSMLFDEVETEATQAPTTEQAVTKSFLHNAGKYNMQEQWKYQYVLWYRYVLCVCRYLHWWWYLCSAAALRRWDTHVCRPVCRIGEPMFMWHGKGTLGTGVLHPGTCWLYTTPLTKSLHVFCIVEQKGHVLRAQFRCHYCRQSRRTWSSSRVFGGLYLVNQK